MLPSDLEQQSAALAVGYGATGNYGFATLEIILYIKAETTMIVSGKENMRKNSRSMTKAP